MKATLIEELERYLMSHRRQHEAEMHQAERVNDIISAQREQLLQRIRDIRVRHEMGRSEIHRELLQLASSVGLLPPPAPEPLDLTEPFDGPRIARPAPNRLAADEAAHAIN